VPNDTIRIGNANLRYYFGISDPDSLSDQEWCALIKELEYVRKQEMPKET
jgi:hypothetical protein